MDQNTEKRIENPYIPMAFEAGLQVQTDYGDYGIWLEMAF